MAKASTLFPHTYIGIDLGDMTSHVCVLDAERGDVVERFRVGSTRAQFEQRFSDRPRARIVLEAGTHSSWASRFLDGLGHEVIVANPRKVALISRSDTKTDRVDAEVLARLGRFDPRLLHAIQHRSAKAQQHLAVLRARDQAVKVRTALINHVRGASKAVGVRLSSCSAPAFSHTVRSEIPTGLFEALTPVLRLVRVLTATIHRYDRTIEALCEKAYPATQSLRQIDGVGALTALTYVLVLDRPERFRRSRMAGAYVGLCPKRAQSGALDPQLSITKAGDGLLRRLLVGSAQYILGPFGPDCALRRIGERLMATGGKAAKKRAVVAVARRLAVLLHHLWKTGEVYEPMRGAPAKAA